MTKIFDALIEKMPGTTIGSKFRNLLSYFVFVISFMLILEVLFAGLGIPAFADNLTSRISAYFWVAMAFIVFGVVVVGVIRLHNANYPVNPGRLIRDTCFSAIMTISSFSLFYRYIGISSDGGIASPQCFAKSASCICDASAIDTLYFSIVTFSTLGFGDFTACSLKIFSALEALLGNLHLGIFVGAVFYYLSERSGGNCHDYGRNAENCTNNKPRKRDT